MTMNLRQSLIKLNLSLSILSKWIIPRLSESLAKRKVYMKCTVFWIDKLRSYISNYGLKQTCKRAKLIRAITLAYLSGSPIRVVKEFISINKKGLPGDLGPLAPLIEFGDSVDRKFVITLLSVTKIFSTNPDPDYGPIEKPFSGIIRNDWELYINRFFRWKHIRKGSLKIDFSQYHLSTKTSPGGKGALEDSLGEVLALKANMSLTESICIVGGKTLTDRLQRLLSHLKPFPIPETLRRIAAIQDKEGKTRLVAILDYWSQTALKPLHSALLGVLRSLNSDMTFNQNGFQKVLTSGPYYSFDLKDATDRFPIALQQKVISYLIGEKRAAAWAEVLIREPYSTKDGPKTYKVGQPMGAYSSWAAFALTHHIVVQRAAMETQKFPFNKYALLGDDIVICDHAVAIRYRNLMEELGVEFSPTKTFISNDMFEFASRIFLKGEEISPFSLRGLWESSKHPASIVEFLRTMATHGWNLLQEGNVPGQIRHLMRLLGSPAFARWNELIEVFYQLPLSVVLSPDNAPKGRPVFRGISCFESQHIFIFRDALILELRDKVERRVDEITELHAEWALALPPLSDFIRSDAGDMPISPANIPIIGVWHALKRQARELANEITEYYYELEDDIPLEKWISDLVGISNTPDISKVLTGRKHKEIILTTSSLVLKAYKRVLREGLIIKE